MKKALGLFVSLIALTVLATPAMAASTVVVTSNDMNGWFFYNDENDTIDNSLGSFVMGPSMSPAGAGSAEMAVSGTQRRNLATYQFSGTSLAKIKTLAFSTYNPSIGNGGTADRSGYLHFNVDFDGSDTWQRRLVYVPRNNGAVVQDAWQEWDAINNGNALWSYSGPAWPVTGEPGTTLKTWDQILSDYPDARIRVTDAFVGIRAGEPYASGYTENVDAFKFATSHHVTTFDFEPLIGPPTTKDECKHNGWKQFNNPSFKSHSKCVSYVKHN